MNQHTDQYYIDRTMQGDTHAFGALVQRYQHFVYTIVIRILKHKEEAEEVAQDTFVQAFSALKGYRGDSRFSTWLYSIAYRKAIDRTRKNKRQPDTELLVERSTGSFQDVEHALSYLEAKEREAVIQDSIRKLPDQEAAIITMYYFDEASVNEIAAITGLTADNIKIKLYRSRKKLFTLLREFILPEISDTNGKAI